MVLPIFGAVSAMTIYVLAGLLVLLVAAGAVAWGIQRRRTSFQRSFAKALRGVGHVQGSIHPEQERLP